MDIVTSKSISLPVIVDSEKLEVANTRTLLAGLIGYADDKTSPPCQGDVITVTGAYRIGDGFSAKNPAHLRDDLFKIQLRRMLPVDGLLVFETQVEFNGAGLNEPLAGNPCERSLNTWLAVLDRGQCALEVTLPSGDTALLELQFSLEYR